MFSLVCVNLIWVYLPGRKVTLYKQQPETVLKLNTNREKTFGINLQQVHQNCLKLHFRQTAIYNRNTSMSTANVFVTQFIQPSSLDSPGFLCICLESGLFCRLHCKKEIKDVVLPKSSQQERKICRG